MPEKRKLIGAAQMRELANLISPKLKGLGFTILVFEIGDRAGQGGSYISNCERESMIEALEETAERLKNKRDFMTPEAN